MARQEHRHALIGLSLGLGAGLFGCSSSGSGVTYTDVGDATLVVTDTGSLIAERPVDDQARALALMAYLRAEQQRFGLGQVDDAALTFEDAVSQEALGDEEGVTHRLVAVRQTHMGAPVIDELQMAAFAGTPAGDELRRVRARLRDPATLPTPPSLAERSGVSAYADALVAEFGLFPDMVVIGDAPVISARRGIAGFRVSQLVPSTAGDFHEFEAIVDPRDGRIVVIADRPPCEPTPLPDLAFTQMPELGVDPSLGLNIQSVRIHAVQLSDADGGNPASITRAQVRRWVQAANITWFPETGFRFAFDDSATSPDFESWRATRLNTLPANEDEHYTYRTVGNVWALLFHHDKLVVFFRDNGGPGFSWGPSTNFFVSMPSFNDTGILKPDDGGVVPNDSLLSHELGHYFGLAHTFGDTSCVDARVANGDGDSDGQEPDNSADDVADTSADMSDVCYATDSLTCVGGAVTFNDEQWSPPWNNVMSYHDCLPEELSDDQVAVIRLTLQHPVRANIIE